MSKPIDQLLKREMNRKEFLMTLGFGMASIMGFSTIIRLLTGKSVEHHLHRQVGSGYSSSSYGIKRESKKVTG